MLHWLKRHPIPIRAFFRHCLVLTYAYPEPILRPLLPAVALAWTLASLLASHYVYDRSALSTWTWLPDLLPAPPRSWASLHAGLDETFGALERLFPKGGTTLDIYDPKEMTEPSIERARRLGLASP
jgi:hypothetical protein